MLSTYCPFFRMFGVQVESPRSQIYAINLDGTLAVPWSMSHHCIKFGRYIPSALKYVPSLYQMFFLRAKLLCKSYVDTIRYCSSIIRILFTKKQILIVPTIGETSSVRTDRQTDIVLLCINEIINILIKKYLFFC